MCGQLVWKHGCQAASYGVCASGESHLFHNVKQILSLYKINNRIGLQHQVLLSNNKICFHNIVNELSVSCLSLQLLSHQTKDVTTAMAEGRFEDAVKLRGK